MKPPWLAFCVLKAQKMQGENQTYIDIFRQHLICRSVFTEDIIVNSCPGSRRPGEEAQHPVTKRISYYSKTKNQTPNTGVTSHLTLREKLQQASWLAA